MATKRKGARRQPSGSERYDPVLQQQARGRAAARGVRKARNAREQQAYANAQLQWLNRPATATPVATQAASRTAAATRPGAAPAPGAPVAQGKPPVPRKRRSRLHTIAR